MNKNKAFKINSVWFVLCAVGVLLTGCATTDQSTSSSNTAVSNSTAHIMRRPATYKADDGRTINIGNSTEANGGSNFKEPHMDKCWLADGFDFKGFDTLYLAPILFTAKIHDDEGPTSQLAIANLLAELNRSLSAKGIFANVVTSEADIKPGARVLKLSNTIVEYAKGGGAARYFVGLYGGGQPALRVQGSLMDGDKVVFTYLIRRSGVSAGARMAGSAMRDEDIQKEDIRSLVLDLTDFIAAISGKYPPAN